MSFCTDQMEQPLALVDSFFVNEIESAALASLPQETPLSQNLNRLTQQFPAAREKQFSVKEALNLACALAHVKTNHEGQ